MELCAAALKIRRMKPEPSTVQILEQLIAADAIRVLPATARVPRTQLCVTAAGADALKPVTSIMLTNDRPLATYWKFSQHRYLVNLLELQYAVGAEKLNALFTQVQALEMTEAGEAYLGQTGKTRTR